MLYAFISIINKIKYCVNRVRHKIGIENQGKAGKNKENKQRASLREKARGNGARIWLTNMMDDVRKEL